MECLTEMKLELLFFRGRFGDQESDVSAIRHVDECTYCSERFQQILQFYNEFNKLYKRHNSKSERYFIRSMGLVSSRWLHIAYPLHLEIPGQVIGIQSPILAAASTDLSKPVRFENLGVLATEDQKLIIRVLKTVEDGEIILHLMSDKEERYNNVLVKVPTIEKEFLSDENGKVHLGKISLPDLEDLIVKVQTPCATFNLSSLDLKKDQVIAQTEVVLTNERNDSIKVEFFPTDLVYTLKVHLLKITSTDYKDHLRIMVTRGKKDRFLRSVHKGVAVFQGLKQDGELKIQIFD